MLADSVAEKKMLQRIAERSAMPRNKNLQLRQLLVGNSPIARKARKNSSASIEFSLVK